MTARTAGIGVRPLEVADVAQLGAQPGAVVLDDDVAAVAQRARVQDQRVADAVDAAALVDVADDADLRRGAPR